MIGVWKFVDKGTRQCQHCAIQPFSFTTSTGTIAKHLHSKHTNVIEEKTKIIHEDAPIKDISGFFKPMNQQRKKELNDKFSHWLTSEGLPYSLRNSDSLLDFVRCATRKLPSRPCNVFQISIKNRQKPRLGTELAGSIKVIIWLELLEPAPTFWSQVHALTMHRKANSV